MTRIGLVGTGMMGQGHLKNLVQMAPEAQVVGVCDVDGEKVVKAAGKWGLTPYTDYLQMLDEQKPEALVIVTPPEFRLGLIKEAVARGIHCFIEKPPAKQLADAREVQAVLAQSNIIHGVGFMYRYSRAVERCREAIAGRRIALVRSQMLDGLALRPNWPRWFFDKNRSGGPLFDQAIHIFDMGRYLLGEPVAISGFHGNPLIPKEGDFSVEESASLTLQYKSGAMQCHSHSWAYPNHVCQIELISDQLHLTLDLGRNSLTGTVDGQELNFAYPQDSYYQIEMQVFLEAVRTRNQSLMRSTYADATSTLAVSLAAVQAVEEQRVVTIAQ